MNPHYEHIRLACVKANPSILDLEIGCHIKTRFFGTKVLPMDAVKGEKSFIKLEDGRVLDVIEILGRPITLQDVVFALSAKLENGDTINMHLNTREQLVFRDSEYPGLYDYNLTKPLSEQSDEVLEWIAKQLS